MTAANSTSPSSAATPRVRLGLGRRIGGGQLGPQLAELVLEVGERAREIRILEADRLRAQLHLPRVEQRRQTLGHVVEDSLAALVLALDLLPPLAHTACRPRLGVAEDVRVARDELRVDAARRRLEIARTALLEQQREEVRLEEQVADLVEQLRVVAGKRGVRDLVGLFDGVRDDRAGRLLAVPRALAAQPLGQLLELDERFRERHEARSRSWSRWSSPRTGPGSAT